MIFNNQFSQKKNPANYSSFIEHDHHRHHCPLKKKNTRYIIKNPLSKTFIALIDDKKTKKKKKKMKEQTAIAK